jgi:hypothetical protein
VKATVFLVHRLRAGQSYADTSLLDHSLGVDANHGASMSDQELSRFAKIRQRPVVTPK